MFFLKQKDSNAEANSSEGVAWWQSICLASSRSYDLNKNEGKNHM